MIRAPSTLLGQDFRKTFKPALNVAFSLRADNVTGDEARPAAQHEVFDLVRFFVVYFKESAPCNAELSSTDDDPVFLLCPHHELVLTIPVGRPTARRLDGGLGS